LSPWQVLLMDCDCLLHAKSSYKSNQHDENAVQFAFDLSVLMVSPECNPIPGTMVPYRTVDYQVQVQVRTARSDGPCQR
jgi:hypothetical protein